MMWLAVIHIMYKKQIHCDVFELRTKLLLNIVVSNVVKLWSKNYKLTFDSQKCLPLCYLFTDLLRVCHPSAKSVPPQVLVPAKD